VRKGFWTPVVLIALFSAAGVAVCGESQAQTPTTTPPGEPCDPAVRAPVTAEDLGLGHAQPTVRMGGASGGVLYHFGDEIPQAV